MVDSTLQNMC